MTDTLPITPVVASTIGQGLEASGISAGPIEVRLSRELITLLSEQLYSSPLKAIEELVINSFDADAPSVHVIAPLSTIEPVLSVAPLIAVYDTGVGMDLAGLSDLWRVGASNKRTEQVEKVRKRKQIGKFGIGKLATYALARRVTYITSTGIGHIYAVTLSFDDFHSSPNGEAEAPVRLDVREIETTDILSQAALATALEESGLDLSTCLDSASQWTLVLLEELKGVVESISGNRLKWILSTAMPLGDFEVFLNGIGIEAKKNTYARIAEFNIAELPQKRIDTLNRATDSDWRVETLDVDNDGGPLKRLVSSQLPSGVSGSAIVTDKSLYGGKSSDLTRSHGFFVKVRGRLIGEEDPLFGSHALSYEVFNRFRAEIDADDLDIDVTAPRESAGNSPRVTALRELLVEVFNEARSQFDMKMKEKAQHGARREHERHYVYPTFVEKPLADALVQTNFDDDLNAGSEADDSWFYVEVPTAEDTKTLVASLYSTDERQPYSYRLEQRGKQERLVEFDPTEHSFTVNADHELALEFKDSPKSMDLLYHLATAEALLEVYLREAGVAAHVVGEVLQRRDNLLRGLAREQMNSPAAIAQALRDSSDSDTELEIALVIAVRSLGFVAKHLGNGGKADGVARFRDYPDGERKITLEAKASGKLPSLSALDFAGLQEHMVDEGADGCLLVAPGYPGGTREDDAAAAKRAQSLKISCWTIDQLARVVASMERHDVTARSVMQIVATRYAPAEVTLAVDALLGDSAESSRALAAEMIGAIRELETFMSDDAIRELSMIRTVLGSRGIKPSTPDARIALERLAAASQGGMTLLTGGEKFQLNVAVEELERRVADWIGTDSSSRRASTFFESSHHRKNLPEI
ncbi:hypothetical protein HD599_002051 [Conyzicola lurida]|uniref:Uncharacterized protein n=1 Tax=Conyzicola lurida TaxID=1172621 RepID=A0A841AN11_9MICO|nr:ATP-binding protein [Conyzicola lurida]MBB5843728.1 hypothetical protein [Conyzicola lurida]